MGLFDAVDQYCERLTPAFWAEPLNAWSNAAFLVAAAVLWRTERPRVGAPAARRDLTVLIALIAVVGVGSFLFHTVATVWAMVADVAPIVLALLWFLWVYLRRALGLGLGGVAAGFAAFGVATGLISALVPRDAVNGSQTYFSCVLALGAMGVRAPAGRGWLYGAAALLTVSLTCRSIDMWVCPSLAVGTHFLWHLLNGATLYAATVGLTEALVVAERREA